MCPPSDHRDGLVRLPEQETDATLDVRVEGKPESVAPNNMGLGRTKEEYVVKILKLDQVLDEPTSK